MTFGFLTLSMPLCTVRPFRDHEMWNVVYGLQLRLIVGPEPPRARKDYTILQLILLFRGSVVRGLRCIILLQNKRKETMNAIMCHVRVYRQTTNQVRPCDKPDSQCNAVQCVFNLDVNPRRHYPRIVRITKASTPPTWQWYTSSTPGKLVTAANAVTLASQHMVCLLYTSPSPRD